MYSFKLNPKSIVAKDENGWQPLHEAVRSGHMNVIKFLVEEGKVDINARTGADGRGGSTLWWSKKYHGSNHPVTVYLEENGAVDVAPGGTYNKKELRQSIR